MLGDSGQFTTLAWQLCHLADLLADERNAVWLGRDPVPAPGGGDPGYSSDVLSRLAQARGT
jgi:hypothetical protein